MLSTDSVGLLFEIRPPHRCPCTNQTVCGELQDKVTALAAAGKLPPFPVEGPGGRSVQPDKMGIETW